MAFQLSQGLARAGIAVQVVTRQTVPANPKRQSMGLLLVRRVAPAGRLKGAGWTALPLLLGYLARLAVLLLAGVRRFDMVFISGMKIIPLAAVPLCRLLRKPCVIRVESPFELEEPISSESLEAMGGGVAFWVARTLARSQRAVLNRADAIIAISADLECRLKQQGGQRGPIVRIPNSIDLDRFKRVTAAEKASLRAQLGIPDGRSVLVNVGRITRSKGMMTLVQAWSRLAVRYGALLVVVGRGKGAWDDCEDEFIEYVERHGLRDHVQLVGATDQPQLYFQSADLCVSPSEYEGFGLTLVEALACCVPVVATRVGVAPELICDGRNGFLCEPKSLEGLVAALEAAFACRDEWSTMGSWARESVLAYDASQIAARYARLCRELCNAAPPRPVAGIP